MDERAYRRLAPRALAAAAARGTSDSATWWLACVLVLGLALASGTPRAQVLQAAAASAPKTTDYVQQSAITDLFEITSSRVALKKSQNPAVRDFAQQMMSEHGRSTAELKRALKDGKVTVSVPTSLDPQHEQDIKALQQKPADQFDQAYLQSQILGHRNALDMQRAYAQAGDNAALKRLAGQATPMVQSHLAKLEVLAQTSFRRPHGPGSGNSGGLGSP